MSVNRLGDGVNTLRADMRKRGIAAIAAEKKTIERALRVAADSENVSTTRKIFDLGRIMNLPRFSEVPSARGEGATIFTTRNANKDIPQIIRNAIKHSLPTSTLLHIFSGHSRYIDYLQTLIIIGDNVNVVDEIGRTPLHIASLFGNVKAVEALLKAGADTGMKNTFQKSYGSGGHTALDLANERFMERSNEKRLDYDEIINLLSISSSGCGPGGCSIMGGRSKRTNRRRLHKRNRGTLKHKRVQ